MPSAPATPVTRSKRPRAAIATADTPRTTPARTRQQRKGKSKATRESEEEKEEASPARSLQTTATPDTVPLDSSRVEKSADPVGEQTSTAQGGQQGALEKTLQAREQKQVTEEATDAEEGDEEQVEMAEEATYEVHHSTAQQLEQEAEHSTDGHGTATNGHGVNGAEAEEYIDVDDDEEQTASQPRVRAALPEDEIGEESKDERQRDDIDEEEDDDGVDEDDEYNFDVDNEPLAPPALSHLDDDEDDDNLRAKEGRRRTSHAADDDDEDDGTSGAPTKFGATLSALLQQPTASPASPLLAAAPLLPIPRDPNAAADRALRLKQRARREWRERAHRTDVQYDEVERRLVRVATRGVVQLFNAVQQQRRTVRLQAASEEKDRADIAGKSKQTEMSKEGFMQLIRTAPPVERAEEETSRRDGGKVKRVGEERSGGWSVLKDDYMLGGKLTDWDKQVDESEEEDELEAEAEMEAE